jgi:hypothetical protein
MTSATFDHAPLFKPGLPAPAAKWAGLAQYHFIGGSNDAAQLPVDGLLAPRPRSCNASGRAPKSVSRAYASSPHQDVTGRLDPSSTQRQNAQRLPPVTIPST